jgi:hypothetical protein
MSDQPVAKVSTYTGQHNTERRRHSWLNRNLKPRTKRSRDQDLRPRPRSHWDRQYKLLMTIIRLTAWYSYHYNYYSYPTTSQEGAWGRGGIASSYSFSTSALDGGEWSASCPSRALAPEERPRVLIVQEAGWAPEPVWTQEATGKILSPLPGIETRSPGHLTITISNQTEWNHLATSQCFVSACTVNRSLSVILFDYSFNSFLLWPISDTNG